MRKDTKAKKNHLHTFSIDHQSVIDDCLYRGTFTTKKMSISDLSAVGVRKAQLNGGMHYDEDEPGKGIDRDTDEFNSMIAQLEISLVQHPDWWDLSTISDVDLISQVYKEVVDFENNFFRKQAIRAMGSNESRGQEADQESLSNGAVGKVVEQDVQSALEP